MQPERVLTGELEFLSQMRGAGGSSQVGERAPGVLLSVACSSKEKRFLPLRMHLCWLLVEEKERVTQKRFMINPWA